MLTSAHGCGSWSLFTHWYDRAVTWAPETRFTRTFILSTDDSSHGVHINAIMSRTRPQCWQRWHVVVLVREDCVPSTLRFVGSFKKRGLRVTLIRNGKDVVSDNDDYLIDILFYFIYTNKLRVLWPFLTINLRIAVVTSWLVWIKRGSIEPSDMLNHPAHAVIV